jgi:molybdate transport system regulatory protein
VKVWLETQGDYVFGWGLCEILAAVQECGSIKEAASQLGKSYRYVWGRIKEAEEALDGPLVLTRVGGAAEQRSDLSEPAARLVAEFTEFRQRMMDVVQQEFAGRFQDLQTLLTKRSPRGV